MAAAASAWQSSSSLLLLILLQVAVGLVFAASPEEAAPGGVTLQVDSRQVLITHLPLLFMISWIIIMYLLGGYMQVVVDNGVVQVELSSPQGQITAVRYNGEQNLLEYNASQRNSGGYWDVVWNYPGSPWPTGAMDMFVMLRGSSGFYCYAIFEHPREYPALNISVARLAFKLNTDKFNYMAISDDIQRYMPSAVDRDAPRGVPLAYKEAVLLVDPVEPQFKGEVDDKYQYSMDNKDNTVHGWISNNSLGFWVVTPSNEFKNGGPLKRELTSHTGPTSLSVFIGPHYIGRDMVVKFEEGEYWKKVLGPVFIYLNSRPGPNNQRELWEDAKAQAQAEVSKWPYSFPCSPDFAKARDRGFVTGRLWVRDRFLGKEDMPAAMAYIGLASPGQPGSWATESKKYQFWTRSSDGRFNISDVREGVYNLYAWVPGFLGDYMYTAPITITPGCAINIGDLVFEPPRSGPTLWEIGIPDRTAAEFYIPDADPKYSSKLFLHKDRYRQYGLWDTYAVLYPENDLVFTVGKSNYSTDWFFAHVTRKVGNKVVPTTWQIRFHLEHVVVGSTYSLRIALAMSHMSTLQVQVNDGAGEGRVFTWPELLGDNNAIARHGIRGTQWSLDMAIQGEVLNEGDNTIYITQTSVLNNLVGVMYDYIRLEGPSQ
ncbi:hypothetical protein EJB05_36273, partial [Eragrostis curvula]